MIDSFYLPRKLFDDQKIYSEIALLSASKYIVVLAEPGGGKTELLKSLSRQLSVPVVTANVFARIGAPEISSTLIIDAFDELAKVDAAGIHLLLGNVRKGDPTHLIISSRSSEWDNAATAAFKAFMGHEPLVVRLCEFDEDEQSAIFEQHAPGEDFPSFQNEVARFDLQALLPNPQFLKLFADAYLESGRRFTDKRSIFEQAVERLAREANIEVARSRQPLAAAKKIEIASEVFTKLLLSGAEGVATNEFSENRMYPLLAMLSEKGTAVEGILATRLFKPGDTVDQHRPVHKIVSEYCAANYLIRRIADSSDPLSLAKCLSVIAPNRTVRDELRGLLGWMASLGNKSIQEAAIDLDPYAVLANGDPSQLDPSSKRRLINRLRAVEEKDPYFRRGDFWRRFSVAGFFTQEIIDEIKPLLARDNEGHLRQLILELLCGSPAVAMLRDELRQLLLAPDEEEHIRELASRCLLGADGYDCYPDLAVLVFQASQASLHVAARIIEALGPGTFRTADFVSFFRVCAHLYPGHRERLERTIGARYFVKRLIASLELDTIQCLLDSLCRNVACTCGAKPYECDCRNGISKIIGSMLDRYFEMAPPPHDPKRVWQWVRNLNFHEGRGADQSAAVRALQEDDLRQGIIAYAFETLKDQNDIVRTRMHNFDMYCHSGLRFHPQDYRFTVDLAFRTDNVDLWTSFIVPHQFYRDKADRSADSLRRHMRAQASEKLPLLREWTRSNRTAAQFEREHRLPSFRHARKMKRRRRQEDDLHAANIRYVQDNRDFVESGRHWSLLVRFALLTLMHPEKIEREFGDKALVRNALRNCLSFIDEHVPDLHRLAELQCSSKSLYSEMILYAACVEIMRAEGTLENVEVRLLQVLRTGIRMTYDAVSQGERDALRTEVDRLIFPDASCVEVFLRRYVEPQLFIQGCAQCEVRLLRDEEVFSPWRATISIEWLERSRGLDLRSLSNLFDIAAQFGSREKLNEIIALRCAEFLFFWPYPTDNEDIEQKRLFWFIRSWYFLDNTFASCWDWLRADRDTVLMLYERSGRMSRGDHPGWPKLTSVKVEAILDAFVDKWPKVELPDHFGTDSPKAENAYRFLTEVIWSMSSDDPDRAIPVLEKLLYDLRYVDFHQDLKSIRAGQLRNRALRDFEAPSPLQVVHLLDRDAVVTVEGLRELVIQELQDFQRAIVGGEFNSASRFYEKGERLGEVRSTEIIAERLSLRLQPKSITVTPEHQLKSANRSDFTVTKVISGIRRLLVTEVKGQWHEDLYTAASAQLYERYSIHPDAEQQGIFLVIWFGADEKVAGLKKHGIVSAEELKRRIEMQIPTHLCGVIDVFVLDVSQV
ncbi:hypothetical protein [Rhizobium sp. BK379]|uniref:NACHT domain-containing protein n=1 Tax=Rhizobium sp. BK379 TaxID=2587059 RepID=UPI00160BF5A6|nr:hypothetical protein [Rhizobium sp. BK379]MBB3440937.1 hypothetical protein [Rhizobium sp. BK379]